MAISDPITENPVITKYKQFVTDKINSAIVFGDDNLPDQSTASFFSGTTTGITTTPDLTDAPITAANIFAVLLKDVNQYTRVRKFTAARTVLDAFGNPLTAAVPLNNEPILATNVAASTNAQQENLFACEWATALKTIVAAGNTTLDLSTTTAFFTKWGTYGVGGQPDTLSEATLSGVSADAACVAATQKYGIALRGSAQIGVPFTANGVGILTAKHSFTIDSADVDHSMIISGDLINDVDLESLFNNLYNAWKTVALDATATGYTESVCHSNCHSNCHNSRNRR